MTPVVVWRGCVLVVSGIIVASYAIATWNPWRLVVLDTTENATSWAGVLGVVVFVLSAVLRQRRLPA